MRDPGHSVTRTVRLDDAGWLLCCPGEPVISGGACRTASLVPHAYGSLVVHHGRTWLAVVDGEVLRRVVRSGWREFPISTGAARPTAGDRVSALVTKGPRFVTEARFTGSAEIVRDLGEVLKIRHRFVAPAGHEPALTSLGLLRVAVGWTHQALGGLVGAFLPMIPADHERIESALREVALTFGPPPSRPAHRRPRTPGRRALIEGRAAWRPVNLPRASAR